MMKLLNILNAKIHKIINKHPLIILFIFSFTLRIIFIILFVELKNPEKNEHIIIPENLLNGYGYSYHWPIKVNEGPLYELQKKPPEFQTAFIPPLSPFINYVIFKLFGLSDKSFFILSLINSIFSSISVLLVFKIANTFSSKKASFISSIISAIFLPSIFGVGTYTGLAIAQLLTFTIILTSIYFIKTNKFVYLFFTCFFLGVVTYVRSEFFILAFLIIILLFVFSINTISANIKSKGLLLFFLSFLIFLLIPTPWIIRNTMLFNKFTLMISSPWYTIRSANNALTAGGASSEYHQNNISILRMDQFPDLIREIEKIPYNQFFEIKADSLFKNNVINFWINNPIKTVKIWFNRLLFLWTIDPYHIKARNPIYMINILISVIFFLIGFYKLFKSIRSEIYSLENKKIFKILLLYSMILIYYSLIFLLTYNQIRYQVFLISILHPFFGFGFLTFTDFIKTIYKNKSITHYVKCSKFVILALIVLFITIYLSYLYYQKEKEYQSFIIFQKEAINGKVIKLNKNNELILLEVNNSPKKYCFHPGYTLDQIKYPFSKFVNIGDSIFKGAYADTLFIPNKRLKYNYIKMTKKLIQ